MTVMQQHDLECRGVFALAVVMAISEAAFVAWLVVAIVRAM